MTVQTQTQLTLEQAIGQKLLVSFIGTEPAPEILALLERQPIAGITLFRADNVSNPAQVRSLIAALQAAAAANNHPPLLIAADQEGGQLIAVDGGAQFPGNLALGATGSTELAFQTGYALGRELAAMGINVNYAPACDVNINPQNPVIGTRSFGEDPQLVARLGAAMIQGMQAAGVAATAKHFPGHGDTDSDTHDGIAVVAHSRDRLRQVEIPPFVAAIEAGVRLVMSAHIAFPAYDNGTPLPATLSPALIRGLLRDELGFGGVVISDALDMGAIAQGPDLVIDALASTLAGVDLLLLKNDPIAHQNVYSGLLHAARRSLLDPADVLASAERVLALKSWLSQQSQPPLEVIGSSAHQALACEIAARSITLVRDDANLLPLQLAPTARVAVVVPQTADLTPADTSSYVSCRLADSVRGLHAATDEFLVPVEPASSDIDGLCGRIAAYDLVIVGTINAAAQPGQAALVNAILDCGVPTIVAALRMPYDLTVYPSAPTYICTYSILDPAVDTLAQALWGRIPFGGRLPVSIPGLYPLGHGLAAQERSAYAPA
ncbi:MAG TPA: glycoside hydrolase family 3 N-terminal domain-containing protein [Herpetosiphonaceae bacterium]